MTNEKLQKVLDAIEIIKHFHHTQMPPAKNIAESIRDEKGFQFLNNIWDTVKELQNAK